MPRGTTPFIHKTWELLCDAELQSIVCWCRKGESFAILDAETFANEVLPQYFKHNNLCSFVRQLNTYGFKKVTSRDCREYEFKHKLFHRDHQELLPHIVRRTAARAESAHSSSPAPSSTDLLHQLVESNKQLAHMMKELEEKHHAAETELCGMRQELGETRHVVHRLEASYYHRSGHGQQPPAPYHGSPPDVHQGGVVHPPPHHQNINISPDEVESKQSVFGGFHPLPLSFPLVDESGCYPGAPERPLFALDALPLNADLEFGDNLFNSL